MATVKKVKKAQDGWVERAACSRGICGKGSISDRKAARMDRREERRARREERREDRQIRREERRASGGLLGRLFGKKDEYKKGGTVKKAQFGCGPRGCMESAEGMTRREYRDMKRGDRQSAREVGDRPMQKLLKGIGISTQEGIEKRQTKKAERRAARGYKTGGKVTKAKTTSMKKGGKISKSYSKKK